MELILEANGQAVKCPRRFAVFFEERIELLSTV